MVTLIKEITPIIETLLLPSAAGATIAVIIIFINEYFETRKSFEWKFNKIKEYIEEKGYRLEIHETSVSTYERITNRPYWRGFWQSHSKTVGIFLPKEGKYLESDRDTAIATLLHELGHARLGHTDEDFKTLTPERLIYEETEAWNEGEKIMKELRIRKPILFDHSKRSHISYLELEHDIITKKFIRETYKDERYN
jgi:hypothetical protein